MGWNKMPVSDQRKVITEWMDRLSMRKDKQSKRIYQEANGKRIFLGSVYFMVLFMLGLIIYELFFDHWIGIILAFIVADHFAQRILYGVNLYALYQKHQESSASKLTMTEIEHESVIENPEQE